MRVAVFISPMEFKDESVSRTKRILERWGIEAVMTSYTSKDCVGSHGAVYKIQINASKLSPEEFDALLLIDGKGVDSFKLYDLRQLLDTVQIFKERGRIIAGIGNALKILARASVLGSTKVALPPDKETARLVVLFKGIVTENGLEFDKNILTAGNHDSAEALADTLVERLGAK